MKNVVKTGKWDVVSLSWLKRVTDEKNWHRETDFLPWEMISGTQATEQRLTNLFDRYGDSYTIDADVESLKRSFEKVEEENPVIVFYPREVMNISRQNLQTFTAVFSIFRNDNFDVYEFEEVFGVSTKLRNFDFFRRKKILRNNTRK